MNLKRHHVLYILLSLSLIVALLVLLLPRTPKLSYTPPHTASSTEVANKSVPTDNLANEFRYEVVTTIADQEKGLGGRTDIPENYAMLFVFPTNQRTGFWMKGMLTSIDIVWVSDTGTILRIDDNASPESYHSDTDAKIYSPPVPVKYVLELRAGETKRQGWTVGTKVELPLPYRS